MVYRCYTEKRPGFDVEASGKLRDLRETLAIAGLSYIRIFNRYDAEGIDAETYETAKGLVFSEPPVDLCYDEALPVIEGCLHILAVEPLPGQYDQRADSCAQCIQLITCGERPLVSAAKVYILGGSLSDSELERIKAYLINPVESREASMDKPATLKQEYPLPDPVSIIDGFVSADYSALESVHVRYGLAMDMDDLLFLQRHFVAEKRDPTVTELKLVDTYWSDHCRHTTFGTQIDRVEIYDKRVSAAFEAYFTADFEVYGRDSFIRPITLMNIATIAMKVLRDRGRLPELDQSEEINACSIKVKAKVDGQEQDWLLMFKNETHNHPTEIEPFGGAATCIGGAIRDPLSGRSYVYQAMRVTGAGDPRTPISETPAGKLPQRKLTTTAAAGYSSYGNQIGLSTGLVREIYHPGYVAKRMEVGAVVGAAPADNVIRLKPEAGDIVILLGGKTGRDGCGGATGSSKTHTTESLEQCAAEVQKGNAPEERKLQRLFRKSEAARLIKRCNDFGAGGVSVAIGELADGLLIYLDKVPKKYEGLDGTELAISESQERMAVVVSPGDKDTFIELAEGENLEATVVALVTDDERMTMLWGNEKIVDLSRELLNSNGAEKHSAAFVPEYSPYVAPFPVGTPVERLKSLVSDLNLCSQRGLGERFDGSIGAGTVLMPYGGKTQLAPSQVMAALLPVLNGETDTCSVMSYGFNPFLSEHSPFDGAAAAIVESVSKLCAAGCNPEKAYLSLQEYFEKLGREEERWGKPLAALLGAFSAQLGLGIAAIGGKDSMSGSFLDMNVPPTLISFAVVPANADELVSQSFVAAGNPVYMFSNPELHSFGNTMDGFKAFHALCKSGKILSARALESGGTAEAIFKLAIGNSVGFESDPGLDTDILFKQEYGAIIAECAEPVEGAILLGRTVAEPAITLGGHKTGLDELIAAWEGVLEDIFPTRAGSAEKVEAISCRQRGTSRPIAKIARPLAVIPVFPGTNCEYDTARAVERAGGKSEILVVRNLSAAALEDTAAALEQALRRCQMLILPGGFSGGDEPDGSGKFIAAFLRNPRITDAIHELIKNRDGLILGICNGFQALIKLGLVPYGEIIPMMGEDSPTLTYNVIGRHQSRYVTTRVSSVLSPWLSKCEVGQLHAIPVSHGEGRFVANAETLSGLIANGQLATQYTDSTGAPSMDIAVNPNGSVLSIEGITSPDGRILGKMGHTERRGEHIAANISGNKHQPIFEGGVEYFR